jgi:phosphoglycolate phosphatase-like HAD superfamily hydrolase
MHICLFDIDGTLIASGGAGRAALAAAFADEFGIHDDLARVEISGRTDRAIIRDLLHAHGIAETPESCSRLFECYLRHLPHFLRERASRILPGIAALLDVLRLREDVAIGLLTGNLRAGARVKLGHFGLFDHFAFGGFGDHHYDRDDVAREALGEVHQHLGRPVAPEKIWVIGDTPLDVRCALAIGARAVAVATGWHSAAELEAHRPDLLLTDLSDPGPLLSQLPAPP